jgi:DNA-binding beta-propeller fold protein YncE
MKNPYLTIITMNGDIIVKCFSSSFLPVIYRFNKNGELIRSMPSFTQYVLSDDKVLVEENHMTSFSPQSRRIATLFKDSNVVMSIDESDNSYWTNSLFGYSFYGIDVDNDTGQVFVSALDENENSKIIEFEGLTGEKVREFSYIGVSC